MRFGFGSLELKIGPCYTNGGGDNMEALWRRVIESKYGEDG